MPSWEVTTADLPAVDPVNIICTIINSRHSNADSKQTAFTILTDFVSTSVAVAGGDVGALAGLALKVPAGKELPAFPRLKECPATTKVHP